MPIRDFVREGQQNSVDPEPSARRESRGSASSAVSSSGTAVLDDLLHGEVVRSASGQLGGGLSLPKQGHRESVESTEPTEKHCTPFFDARERDDSRAVFYGGSGDRFNGDLRV
jgi:hypothetical protein